MQLQSSSQEPTTAPYRNQTPAPLHRHPGAALHTMRAFAVTEWLGGEPLELISKKRNS
jgi:hypothetical protein